MKSLRMRRNRELYFLGLPDPPDPGPDEVLVRMKYASICGFDMMMLNGKAAYPKNGVLGHEGSGIIEAVGKRVSPAEFKPGDRVAINPYTFCGQCDACRSNQPNFCINPGGRSDLMTEYISIDAKQAFLLPTEVSLPAGSLIEPLMMAMHAISKARLDWGKNLIILGGGDMGQIILKLARQYPLGKIVVAEPVAAKPGMAQRFGADVVLDPSGCNLVTEALLLNGGMGYDAVIEASGSRGSAQTALNIVARGGSVVYFGLYGMDFNLEVNLFNLYWKDATISCVCVPSGYFPSAIAMAGRLRLEEVVTGLFPFSQGIQAFAEKASGVHAKVMLQFDKEG